MLEETVAVNLATVAFIQFRATLMLDGAALRAISMGFKKSLDHRKGRWITKKILLKTG